MKLVTVKMPEHYVRGIDELVRAGRYSSRSEVIRIAVREFLKHELFGIGGIGYPEPLREERPAGYVPNVLRGVGLGGEAEEDPLAGEPVESVDLAV